MRINEVTYEKLKTPLKVNGNLNWMTSYLLIYAKMINKKTVTF